MSSQQTSISQSTNISSNQNNLSQANSQLNKNISNNPHDFKIDLTKDSELEKKISNNQKVFESDKEMVKLDPSYSPRIKEGKKSKINIIDDADRLKQRREERKLRKEEKKIKVEEEINSKCDVEFEKLIMKKKINFQTDFYPHGSITGEKVFVIVRKRPIFTKEVASGEIDCLTVRNPSLFIHEPRIKIDGITKYIEDHEFTFDNVFGDHEKTEQVYQFSMEPTIDLIFSKGIITCFAYGQTGSGKTYTMKGIQQSVIKSLFASNVEKRFDVFISFFEIYGERLYDLLNSRNKLQVLEDKNQIVQIYGLEEKLVSSPEEMEEIILKGNNERTTQNTVTNETSSRSHAICNIIIKEKQCDEFYGKLTLVDLAGSERAYETKNNNKNRLTEGADINLSLLALKECIRALENRKSGNDNHVPFRNNKLTLVLRDSFLPKNPEKAKIIMIACVNPCFSSSNHTLNTLRYSDRLKEKTRKKYGNQPNKINIGNNKENNIMMNLKKVDKFGIDEFKMMKDDMLINMKSDDIEFDEKDLFLKDNIDYYDDFLVEDKIQDFELAKENFNIQNKVRPVKPSVKTTFKPREKKSTPNNLVNPNTGNLNVVVPSNNKFQANFNAKSKDNVNPNKEGQSANSEVKKNVHPKN